MRSPSHRRFLSRHRLSQYVLALVSCGCASDSGAVDASLTEDAGRDAGRDAAVRDAPDAGPTDPEWVVMSGLPADCPIARAVHPERLAAIRWVPCGSGPPSCLLAARRDARIHEGWVIDGEPWVTRFFLDGPSGPESEALGPIDGRPIAAWREPYYAAGGVFAPEGVVCGVFDIAVGGSMAAISISHYSRSDRDISGYGIYVAPRAEIATIATPTAEWLGLAFGVATQLNVSDDAFMYRESTGRLLLYHFDGTWTSMTSTVPGLPDPVMLVGDHVLWQAWTAVSRLAHGSFDIPPAIFRDAAPEELQGLSTDGTTMVWQLATGFISTGVYERIELWAAPHVRDVSALAPRFVRVLDNLELGSVGGRWYAYRDSGPDPDEVGIVDLTDGSLRIFHPPTAEHIPDDPIYVTEHEILVETTVGYFRFDPHELPVEP